jgi:predicted permease
MIDITILFIQVAVLVLMIIPGFLLAKFRLSNELLGKGVSNIILYAAQPALIISGYAYTPYNPDILQRMLAVLFFSILVHTVFTLVAFLVYHKAPAGKKQPLMFATVFTNAGYMGIPLLKAIFGAEVAIYGSIYVFVFNVFVWSVGAYLYTGDRKYISAKKMILNPATVSAIVGLVFFVLSAFGANPFLLDLSSLPIADSAVTVFRNLINGMEQLVAPLAMLIIGLRLAEVDFSRVFCDKWLYLYLVVGMLLTPALIWGISRLIGLVGIYYDAQITNIILLSTAAPAATATSMFAEKFDGDAAYAGVLVSVSSLLCLATMPLVSLLSLI